MIKVQSSIWVLSSSVNVSLSPQSSSRVVKNTGFIKRFATCRHLFSDRTDDGKNMRTPLSESDVETDSKKNTRTHLFKGDVDFNNTQQNSVKLSKDVSTKTNFGMSSQGQIPFRRRHFMAPGSRIASLLPEQYWQSVGENQKFIEKTAGKVDNDLKSEELLDAQKANLDAYSVKKGLDMESELQHKPEASVLPEKALENVPHLLSRFRHRRGLSVSSRLHQMMENEENFVKEDTEEGNLEIHEDGSEK